VAIDTLDDMRTAFDGIPLDEVCTSMTINAPAAVLLLLYELVAEEQGVDSTKLAAPSRTTSSRSTSPAGTSSSRPSRACG
jgi:methylmalonyl-CoA mutase N-terminal domain/subunit